MAGLPKNKRSAAGGNNCHHSGNGVDGGAGGSKFSALEMEVDDVEGDEDEMEYVPLTSSKKSHENRKNHKNLLKRAKRTLFFLFALFGIAFFLTLSKSVYKLNYNLAHTGGAKAALKGKGSAFEFSYDRAKWERNRPRIVVLATPHKAGSSSNQIFFASVACSTVRLTNKTYASRSCTPHPLITDWAWPLGVHGEEEELDYSLGGGFRFPKTKSKYYSRLGALIAGGPSMVEHCFPHATQEDRDKVRDYYRALFRRSWEEGKNIVFGTEIFDGIVKGLFNMPIKSDHGEEMHVPRDSSEKIDALLDVLPWDGNSTTRTTTSLGGYVPPLRLEDIEVQINFRTPRISHLVSKWHQSGKVAKTMRKWISYSDPFQIDSLALALQFVRRGIRTSIVDMKGVSEETSEEALQPATNEMDNKSIVGGMEGVIACEIMRVGENRDGLCDKRSRLHLPGFTPPDLHANIKSDGNVKNLTEEQLDEMNSVLDEYDCGVWKYLKKYQAKGTLRILYPSKSTFENCNPNDSTVGDVSWTSTIFKLREINSRENDVSNHQRHPL